MVVFTLASLLEQLGHTITIWIDDPHGFERRPVDAVRSHIIRSFAPIRGPVFYGLANWLGADVAIATAWHTAYAVSPLPRCRLKVYFVQDHEPEFYPTSAEQLWAAHSYGLPLTHFASSEWLRDVLQARYGVSADVLDYGVDHSVYHETTAGREPHTIAFYARSVTPRRGTEIGLLALSLVKEARPETQVVLFGDASPPGAPFEFQFLGVQSPWALASLFNRATIGLVISLTNYSLVPKEMMACGLPVVDVHGSGKESVFGAEPSVITLADPDPHALAGEIVALLDDPARRDSIRSAAIDFVRPHTWHHAAGQIDAAVRRHLSDRLRHQQPAYATRGVQLRDMEPVESRQSSASPHSAPSLDERYVTRKRLADRYISGVGIEIGPLHRPLPVPPGATIQYVDRMPESELRAHYPEYAGADFVHVDVIDDGERLHKFKDDSLDFVIANHFIEHCEDPIGTIESHLRVLRPGATYYLAAPDMRRTFDAERPLTSLEHLVRDYHEGPTWSRESHFREWARLVMHADDVEGEIDRLIQAKYSIHFHVWTQETFLDLLLHCRQSLGFRFEIEAQDRVEEEFITVLRKTS
jgi:glycosyltransferase involved in cell wall biosynthesis/SAM-dependent methyltransferase